MGGFYVNFHAKSEERDRIADALREATDRVWMTPPATGWISFYDDASSSQNEERIMELAEQVSRLGDCPLIAFCIHDSDVLLYWLYDRGQLRDRFNSCPDYFGDLEEMFDAPERAEAYRHGLGGQADVVAACCGPGVDASALSSLIAQNDFSLMAEQRLERLAQTLGIPAQRCLVDFQTIGRDIGADDLNLQWLGKDPQPEASDQLAELRRRQAEATKAIAADVQLQLNHAIARGQVDEVVRLLDEGADANGTPSDSPGTPLTAAVTQARDPNLVKLLLDRGADVHRREAFGKTALSYAMIKPHPEIVQALIRAGADVNVLDEEEETPLFLAVESRDPHVVKLLVDAGADPDQPARDGQNPREFIEETIEVQERYLADTPKSDKREIAGLQESLNKAREIVRIFENR